MKRFAVITALVTTLCACAAAPPATYEPAADMSTSGYLTGPADNGRYTVVYTGSKTMTREQVAEFAMLRAAELTTESGQEWFAVIDRRQQSAQLAARDDLKSRTGVFSGGETTGTGAGGAGNAPASGGTRDAATRGGPSTGGFGGGDVPYQVTERWRPPTVYQTILIIQMGKGESASFPGLTKAPEIFPAKSLAAEIRGKMNK